MTTTFPDIGLSYRPPIPAEPLTAEDYESLRLCGISRQCADRAGLFRVESVYGASLVGRDRVGNYGGIVFPYFAPGQTLPCEYRLRRDRPDLTYDKDQRPKEKNKYLSPPGRGNRAYFPPGTKPEWLTESRLPILICEGEKKALSCWELSWYGVADSISDPRFVVIGLAGVWSWLGKIGRDNGSDGSRRDVKGVIPDLVGIKWAGRTVTIVFDVNVQTNEGIAAARGALAKELRDRGADVSIVNLPAVDGVNGIDDLIGQWGPERVLTVLTESSRSVGPDNGIVRKLADEILKTDHFAQDAGGLLYVFERGVYSQNGAERVRRRVKELLESWEQDKSWSTHRAEEVCEYIRIDSPRLWDKPPLDTLNLMNCLLDVTTGGTRDHTPEHLSNVQLPVSYDPTAKCPAWDEFVAQTFVEDGREIAFEIVAWLMTPNTSIQKAVLLSGEGANGKSVYLAAVCAFLGGRNVAAVPLHRLEADRFSVARLAGKLANVCADLPSEHLQGTSVFKALTGGDSLLAERKYAESFELIPYARLVFSANHPPRSSDASEAFFRRWIVVPFERTFEGAAATPRAQLDARLADPRELSGVLNRAVNLLGRVRANGLTETESMRLAWDEFRQVTEPLAVWLDRETVDCGEVTKKALLVAYNEFAARTGQPPMNRQGFGRAIRRLRTKVGEAQRGPDKEWVYVGLGLRAESGAE